MVAPTETDATPAVKSAGRALRLIEVLATVGSASFTDLRSELDIPKSSLHALLAALKSSGWVVDHGHGEIALGYRAHAMGLPGLDESAIIALADDLMEDLHEELDQTIHLATLDGNDVVYLTSKFSRHALNVRFEVGRRLPAYATALGKAMLSTLPDELVLDHLPETLEQLTPKTVKTRKELFAELDEARARGYTEEDEQSALGLHCFAVPLAGEMHNIPPVAVSCSIPKARLDDVTSRRVVTALLRLRERSAARINPVQAIGDR